MHIYLFILSIMTAITLEIYIYDVIIITFFKVYYYYLYTSMNCNIGTTVIIDVPENL